MTQSVFSVFFCAFTNCMVFLRAMTKVDVDPDLVHMEIQDIGGGKSSCIYRKMHFNSILHSMTHH